MRTTAKSGGLTVRAIAGTYNILIGFDLAPEKRAGCLGFTITRTNLATNETRFLPNRITFASTPEDTKLDTSNSPLQKFRWGDYTASPATKYRYTVTARYGKPGQLTDGDSVSVEVTTEDPRQQTTPVFFNRGAAASQAYNDQFGANDPDKLDEPKRTEALAWLSRGLEEAVLAFMDQAKDKSFGLHAAVYEFQKPNLVGGLKKALDRGVDVQVVYHYRHKNDKDKTWKKNEAAATNAGLTAVCTQRTQDPGVIMHNKFMVLLKNGAPIAVWSGSTNWTDGGIYGQLNVGHAVYDANVAKTYEAYFQLLKRDLKGADMKKEVTKINPIPGELPGPGVMPILSPQSNRNMLNLYHIIAQQARTLLVSAPFELADEITDTFNPVPKDTLHYLLLDKEGSLGKPAEIGVVEHNQANGIAFGATLESNLTSFQDKLLKNSKESYHHAGVHIHSKIILADPFGDDPMLVTGSANFSTNSTIHNDSNSLFVRGDTGIADVYSTEFMRMYEHYHFRGAAKKAGDKAQVITLSETDDWTKKWYVDGSNEARDRMLFAGTLPKEPPNPVTAFQAIVKTTKVAAKKVTTATKKVAAKVKKTVKPAAKKVAAKVKKTVKPATKKVVAKVKKAVKPAAKKTATKKKPPSKKVVAKVKKAVKPAAKKAATKKKPPSKKKAAPKKKIVPKKKNR
jgi:phosphatidylserine/phosphatidylglycerophosphate/cardiolipin synthase-like enzyme